MVSWVLFFFGLWLLDIPFLFGENGPLVSSIIFYCGFLISLFSGVRSFHRASQSEVDKRLEKASGLSHRPLQTIEDRLATQKTRSSQTLWMQNKLNALHALKSLKIPFPKAVLAKSDPYALRFIALLFFGFGLVATGHFADDKIKDGLLPLSFESRSGTVQIASLIITPPEYTTRPRITLLSGSDLPEQPIIIPAGSTIRAKVNSGFFAPKLSIGSQIFPLQEVEKNIWSVETQFQAIPDETTNTQPENTNDDTSGAAALPAGKRIQLTQWPRTLVSAPYLYVPDQPPSLAMAEDISFTRKAETIVKTIVQDDYGVKNIGIDIELDPIVEDHPAGERFTDKQPVFSAPNQAMDFQNTLDLAWHPWAGLPVRMNIEIQDEMGQKATINDISLTLPQRTFTNPVSKQLVDIRKKLIWNDIASIPFMVETLEEINAYPEMLENDPVVILALQTAASRLLYADNGRNIQDVIELLWDVSIRLEDGNLPQAIQNLRTAQKNLQELLSDPDASDEAISEGMADLRQALSEYFMELLKEHQKQLAEQGIEQNLPLEMFQNMVNPQDLNSFLDQMLADALTGDTRSAQEMLSELQNFMEQMGDPGNFSFSPQMEFQMKGISDLQKLIEQQEALLFQTEQQYDQFRVDRLDEQYPEYAPFGDTFERDENGRIIGLDQWRLPFLNNGKEDPESDENAETGPETSTITIDTSQNKVEQDALRYALGQLMLEADNILGDIPEAMQLAEQEMRSSGDFLEKNDPEQSIPHQEQAIEHLRDSMDEMSQQLQQSLQAMSLFSFGPPRTDPLGRPIEESGNGQDNPFSRVQIPDKQKRKRIEDILNILRQRSGEFNRPDYELDYYRRLMQQF